MSRVNHEVSYFYDVEGETVWEKLRVIRDFLFDRQQAYDLGVIGQEEQVENMKGKEGSYAYRKWQIQKVQSDKLLQDCLDEIEFLKKFESWLKEEAEKTRIFGKTDEEMYEINYYDELKLRLVKRAQAQLLAVGHVEPDTLQRIFKNKQALQLACDVGIINSDSLPYINQIPYIEHSFGLLQYTPEESKND
jgi:hypothetical protein